MKTVYILGAGFSVDAGAPTQQSIISKAFDLNEQDESNFDKCKFEIFRDFIVDQLNVEFDNAGKVDLEDIFTPLDRCINENSQYRGVSVKSLADVREATFYVVGKTIQLLLNKTTNNKDYIDLFAKSLISHSRRKKGNNYPQVDPVSVISTNWDILLDNSVYHEILKSKEDAVVDYCCYISSLTKEDKTVKPGLEVLGRGGYNVKILKVHGSLNWLQCPRCMRLYVSFPNKEAIYNFQQPSSCRHCDHNFPEEIGNHNLYSNLIMPTFIKDLTNPQYKIVWQNAGVEISEADKLVFIGYSLPSADFDMRQLLSRMTRKSAEIEVVDKCNDPEDISNKEAHWRKFFGKRDISFHFNGASDYLSKIS
ncbi:hypothetical protein [Pantoea agglomerans]|uniref:hypothetical protein n=1 Tax=Enterobacter agglomerans TaxID=549 RepID=UPI0006DD5540|nr:hypothetical protein [Pantoea agglomerans]KPA06474.1 hypothetical protein PAP10c_2329 [Pantoea agglomerans]